MQPSCVLFHDPFPGMWILYEYLSSGVMLGDIWFDRYPLNNFKVLWNTWRVSKDIVIVLQAGSLSSVLSSPWINSRSSDSKRF